MYETMMESDKPSSLHLLIEHFVIFRKISFKHNQYGSLTRIPDMEFKTLHSALFRNIKNIARVWCIRISKKFLTTYKKKLNFVPSICQILVKNLKKKLSTKLKISSNELIRLLWCLFLDNPIKTIICVLGSY